MYAIFLWSQNLGLFTVFASEKCKLAFVSIVRWNSNYWIFKSDLALGFGFRPRRVSSTRGPLKCLCAWGFRTQLRSSPFLDIPYESHTYSNCFDVCAFSLRLWRRKVWSRNDLVSYYLFVSKNKPDWINWRHRLLALLHAISLMSSLAGLIFFLFDYDIGMAFAKHIIFSFGEFLSHISFLWALLSIVG